MESIEKYKRFVQNLTIQGSGHEKKPSTPAQDNVVLSFMATSTLTTLDLSYNSIGPNGAQVLTEALKTNSTLAALKLPYNSIGDNGAQTLSEALKTSSALTTLHLGNNSIGDNGVQA
ncbi:hypothetical protein BGZ90_009916, partial [Linnemannia elongata]